MKHQVVHVHAIKPFFVLAVDPVDNWHAVSSSATTIRFNPGDRMQGKVKFEVPPSINMIYPSRIKPEDIVVKDKDEGKNASGVSYKAVYLNGWETTAYQMKFGDEEIYLNDGIGDHSDHGLLGSHVLKQARDSFKPINPDKLSDGELILIIEASKYNNLLWQAQSVSASAVPLDVQKLADKYVISLKGFREGPVFHVSKKDLSVTHLSER